MPATRFKTGDKVHLSTEGISKLFHTYQTVTCLTGVVTNEHPQAKYAVEVKMTDEETPRLFHTDFWRQDG